MADDLQIPGGSAETENSYVGPVRALRADESNWELRLHDGVTPGGFRFLNYDQLLEIFQPGNSELDGFDFSAGAKGWLTRVGPAAYRLRTLEVEATEFALDNPQGLVGNPKISLQYTIETGHNWTQVQIYDAAIQADGGVLGDLTGDVTGNVTGNLTGNVTGNVTGNLVGDVDVRGHDFQVDDGSIDWTKLDPASIPSGAAPIPSGGIMLWSGAADAIPSGWFLCDGTNATPDLRGQFIAGAGGDLDVGESGGTTDHNHVITITASGVHSHTITIDDTAISISQMPNHQHGSGVCDTTSAPAFNHGHIAASPTSADSVETNTADGTVESLTTAVGGGTGHNHTATIDDSTTHTHSVASENTAHLPPYYALCYIMKA